MIQKLTIDDGDSDSYYKASDGIQVYEQYYKNVTLPCLSKTHLSSRKKK